MAATNKKPESETSEEAQRKLPDSRKKKKFHNLSRAQRRGQGRIK